MRTKEPSVQCAFHSILTGFLFRVNQMYLDLWDEELIITSGSETTTIHSYTSLHYSTPCQAADTRNWDIIIGKAASSIVTGRDQFRAIRKLANSYCRDLKIPINWFDIILESDHIHTEYQPKRLAS